MEKYLVSVVLPVYNVERYLNKCIESVVNQTYKNLEIILVDDGANDSSPAICEIWAKKDQRIVVVHKKNAGLGMARNSGLDIAHGSYIMFIDSDDFVEKEAINKLLGGLKGADTVFCGHYIYYDDYHIETLVIKHRGKSFEGNDVQKSILLEIIGALPSDPVDTMLPVSVCYGLYSMDIINKYDIRFSSERKFISEDLIFNIDYLSRSKMVSFIENCLYYYRKNNESSLTTVYNKDRFKKEIILYTEICRKMELLMPQNDYLLRAQRTFLGRVRSCITRAEKQTENPMAEIKKICNDDTVMSVVSNYPYYRNKITLRIFNFCLKYKLVGALRLMAKLR